MASYDGSKYTKTRTASGLPLTEAVPGLPCVLFSLSSQALFSSGHSYFTPITRPAPGSYNGDEKDAKTRRPRLLSPLKMRETTFKNRVFLSPMAQYSCEPNTGIPTDFHFVHYGTFALRGVACIATEACSVMRNGGITPEVRRFYLYGSAPTERLHRTLASGTTSRFLHGDASPISSIRKAVWLAYNSLTPVVALRPTRLPCSARTRI